MTTKVLLISPVMDEIGHIEQVVHGVSVQTRLPDRWIVIDDGSRDGTYERLLELQEDLPFLTVVRSGVPAFERDGLAAAREALAFNAALGLVDRHDFTHIGKLDGDVELPPDYLERLLIEFAGEARLGIAGGGLVENDGRGWRRIAIPSYHVHGAVKLYSRDCFEVVGGIQERLGWDTIDETYARMAGFETRTPQDLIAYHHRPWGSAGGRLRGRARHGTCAYILRYPADWVFLRSFKVARYRPLGLSGLAFAYGYVRAATARADKVEDPAFKRYVRRELRGRMRRPLQAWRSASRAGARKVGSSPDRGSLTS